jgi:Phosphate-selective porin O and P
MKFSVLLILVAMLLNQEVYSQTKTDSIPTKPAEPPKKWFESISIRGYAQVRYNRLLETNQDLKCEQCDRSIGKDGGFFLRRMRFIFFGQINKQAYFYVQPDIASSASTTGLHFAQLRDAYFDIGVDKKNEFRFRMGQSKIPFGFENLQSSQNRMPLDRADALNSSLSNERDLGVKFYWAPERVRKQFSSLVRDGLKGSGDYGVFAIGAYNGQTANRSEANQSPYFVTRLTYPVKVGRKQIIEPSVQFFSGKYTFTADQLSSGVKYHSDLTYIDTRQAATFVLYPQPFGVLAEFNTGKGPEFNPVTDSIEVQKLSGGFVTFSYRAIYKNHQFYPFLRYQQYEGGKKHERDARSYSVEELEIGLEWQPMPQFELVAMYTISDRRAEDFQKQSNRQKGQLLRLQAQVNF